MRFCQRTFGWKVEKLADPNNWLATTGDDTMQGINGVIMEKSGYVTATTDTFDVPSHEDAIKKIVGVRGKVLMPRTVAPGIGYMAYYEDTEGNVLGITKSDLSAK